MLVIRQEQIEALVRPWSTPSLTVSARTFGAWGSRRWRRPILVAEATGGGGVGPRPAVRPDLAARPGRIRPLDVHVGPDFDEHATMRRFLEFDGADRPPDRSHPRPCPPPRVGTRRSPDPEASWQKRLAEAGG